MNDFSSNINWLYQPQMLVSIIFDLQRNDVIREINNDKKRYE